MLVVWVGFAEKRAKQHPKGAINSMRYMLLRRNNE